MACARFALFLGGVLETLFVQLERWAYVLTLIFDRPSGLVGIDVVRAAYGVLEASMIESMSP